MMSRDAPGVSAVIDRSGAEVLASFGAFARRNQLSGFVHTLVADPAFEAPLPAALRGGLQRRHAMESRKRELLLAELVRVTEAFHAAGVACIVLKGPALATRFYGSEDRRSYWDLDLLVRQDDLARCRRVLRDLGFQRLSPMLFGERISLAVAHALDFSRNEVGLDLHWKLSNHPSFRIDYRRVWERAERGLLSGRTCSVLSPDYLLTLVLLSSFKDIERGALRLRSFVDLWMILDRIEADLEWAPFLAERSDENIRVICVSVLALFLVVFQAGTRFPHLAQALTSEPDVARVPTRAAALQLIEPTFLGPARRLWASGLYETSRARHLIWWALSLPVRLNVHKPGKVKRLSDALRAWLRRHR